MNKLKFLALTLVLVTLLPALAVSQRSPKSSTPAKTEFVSVQGEFSIALPPDFEQVTSIEPVEGASRGGDQYVWNRPEGFFMLGVINLLSAENPQQAIDAAADRLIEKSTSKGGRLIARKNIPFQGGKALEIRVQLNAGTVAIGRYYIAKTRLYVLTSGWRAGDDGQAQLKILDSFKLIDAKAVVAKKIAETAPKPLPQTPAIKKLKSDAEDENLRGKVKTVTEESEDLSGEWEIQGRHVDSITDYDQAGNRIKRLLYDSKALPFESVVYGYLDGMRVRNSEAVEFDDNPRLYSIGTGPERPKAPKAPDPRYDYSFEYKYTDGKLSEEKWIMNDGSLWLTYVYNYKDGRLEQIVYDSDGKINQKYLSLLDEKGNEIERTDVDVLGNGTGDSKYSIKYESFDEKGNWTKKITHKIVVENGKQTLKPLSVDYRTITYHP